MYYQCNLDVKKNIVLFGKYCGSLAGCMDLRLGRAAASATNGERGLAGALTAAPFLLYG